MGFSPPNKLVARDLMTAPFCFVCLNSVNSNFNFSSSCKKIASEYDQEIPQSQTADNTMAP